MREGMLWFDNDPKRGLDEKVQLAAAHYRNKFGRRPNACYVHPAELDDGEKRVGDVRVSGLPSVLKHHLWVGEENRS